MKKSPVRSGFFNTSSFTLVELLVVMGIIAILAATLLSVGSMVINMAKRTKAANTATQIQTAALGYYTEYSIYPVPGGTSGDYILDDTSASNTKWGTLICILCGNIQPSTAGAFTTSNASMTNSRGIAFLTLKSSDVDSFNAPVNPLSYVVGTTTNNAYFNIAIDSDYDGLLGTTGNTSGKLPNFAKSTTAAMDLSGTSTAGVAVWENCNGKASLSNPNYWVHTY